MSLSLERMDDSRGGMMADSAAENIGIAADDVDTRADDPDTIAEGKDGATS
jgi:hypothetical protein